ncbi:MAG: hypothetical protein M1825_004575 [Sarcosagium campestre]|nr:MAG: hypothetical protein M1825_004575 [Sarcosagium campestre]
MSPKEPPSPKTIPTEYTRSSRNTSSKGGRSLKETDPTEANNSNRNIFPLPAGKALASCPPRNGLPSPFQSNFTWDDKEGHNVSVQVVSSKPDILDDSQLNRPLGRDVPGDGAHTASKSSQADDMKRKGQYFAKAFAYREPMDSARETITRDSVIMADFKTNVIVDDEYTIVTELSCYLSARYHRPESSIVVNIDHSGCLLLGGSFEPAYILTITALPSQVQPATNKRNAILIQNFVEESLGVGSSRGIIKFVPIAEGNLAMNGHTVLGEIEALEKKSNQLPHQAKRCSSNKSLNKSAHKRSLLSLRARASTLSLQGFSALSTSDSAPPVPPIPTDKSVLDRKAERVQKLSRRRSFLALFGKRD